MNAFNVTLIAPHGNAGAMALWDTCRLLQFSLRSLGYDAALTTNHLADDATNIVVGYHLISDASVLGKSRVIIYQLEQLSEDEGWFTPQRLDVLQRADQIWDYSPANIRFLKSKGIGDVQHVPLGFHEKLQTVAAQPKEFDVLFYGTLNGRRKKILDALADRCRLQTLTGLFGAQRDAFIARSRIILNIHYYETRIMEQVRLSYLFNNGCFVLSETSPEDPFAGMHASADYENLVVGCERFLADDAARDRIATTGLNEFRKKPMVDHLRAVLPRATGTGRRVAKQLTPIEAAGEHLRRGQLNEAEQLYRRILDAEPKNDAALHALGLIAHRVGKHEIAIELIRRALTLQPRADYFNNLGVILNEHRDFTAAALALRSALKLKPDYVEAHYNLGNALFNLGQLADAAGAFRQAIALRPDYLEAHGNLGNTLLELQKYDAAINAYQNCLRLNPNLVIAHRNLGTIKFHQGLLDEAVAAYRSAIALQPNDPKNHFMLGYAQKALGRLDEAIASYRKAIDLNPTDPQAADDLCFTLIYHSDYDARAIARELAAWNQQHAKPLEKRIQPHANSVDSQRRLRVGYVSPHFRDHCQCMFMIPLLSHHDRRNVEVFCYSDVARPDEYTERIRALSDQWRPIAGMSDDQVADLVRADAIDVLVDLTLHMRENRLRAFAQKPAPVQVTWLGYPGSTGMTAMDFRLTDPYLDPPAIDESIYSETTVRLPHTFWCYDPLEEDLPVQPLPALTSDAFTFGCLNHFSKVQDCVLQLWSKVLGAAPHARMMILCDPCSQRERALEILGVDKRRIEFVTRLPRREYLQLYNRIDLCLDTFPANGHTTSLDALWMGVPTVTLVGANVLARAGFSQLSNIGLTEMAAFDESQFVRIAVEWSKDRAKLANLRLDLRRRMERSPLMDAPSFARDMEHAYREMWRAWSARR